jgi:hypothetical protein
MELLGNVLKQLDQLNRSKGRMTVEERLDRVKKHPIYRQWISEREEDFVMNICCALFPISSNMYGRRNIAGIVPDWIVVQIRCKDISLR